MENNYFAVYDCQLNGFKPSLAFKSKTKAFKSAIERIESIHFDIFEDEEIKSKNWKELKKEFNLKDEKDFVEFFDYKIKKVSRKEYVEINKNAKVGLTKTV